MKKFFAVIALAGLCLTAAAQQNPLEKKARADAQKVTAAANLTPAQNKQVYEFQLARYTSIDSLKQLGLEEADLKKQTSKINNLYQKRAEGIMTPEQLAAFKEWKAQKAQNNKK